MQAAATGHETVTADMPQSNGAHDTLHHVHVLVAKSNDLVQPVPDNHSFVLWLQWQDACQVTAARYVPILLLLSGALFCTALPGTALPLLPPGIAAVTMVVAAVLLAPVPIEVTSHQRCSQSVWCTKLYNL